MRYILKENELKKLVENAVHEAIVQHFTPYSKEDRERNFIPFTDKDTRTPQQRNPAYAKALKDAQERKKKRQQQKYTN